MNNIESDKHIPKNTNLMLNECLEKIDELIDGAWATKLYSNDMITIAINRKTLEPIISRYRKKDVWYTAYKTMFESHQDVFFMRADENYPDGWQESEKERVKNVIRLMAKRIEGKI